MTDTGFNLEVRDTIRIMGMNKILNFESGYQDTCWQCCSLHVEYISSFTFTPGCES